MPYPASLIWVNDGLQPAANQLETWLAGLGLQWALFVNNPALTLVSHWSDLVEASFPGYARVLSSGWNVTAGVNGGFVIDTDPPSFVLAAFAFPVAVPGWALVKPGPDTLYYAGKFDTPFMLLNPGDTVIFDPAFLVQSQMQAI